jgi:hypothetical protein
MARYPKPTPARKNTKKDPLHRQRAFFVLLASP